MRRKLAVVVAATLCSIGLGAAVITAIAGGGSPAPPFPPNPNAGKSDAQRQAEVDAARQRAVEYLRNFVAAGTDPRTLPDFPAEQFQGVDYKNQSRPSDRRRRRGPSRTRDKDFVRLPQRGGRLSTRPSFVGS